MTKQKFDDYILKFIPFGALIFVVFSASGPKFGQMAVTIFFAVVFLGSAYIFWLKPILKRKKNAKIDEMIKKAIHQETTNCKIKVFHQAINRIERKLGLPLTTDEDLAFGFLISEVAPTTEKSENQEKENMNIS